ncbi:unnamed protein product [Symbiodinium sp. CCMP2592]|nr:unnamed protein product [Symbiodinium sp. CCMP2592]
MARMLECGMTRKTEQAELALELTPSSSVQVHASMAVLAGNQQFGRRLDQYGRNRAAEIKNLQTRERRARELGQLPKADALTEELARRKREHALLKAQNENAQLQDHIHNLLTLRGAPAESDRDDGAEVTNSEKEHRICFLPSYKWHPDRDAYDIRSQKHVPVRHGVNVAGSGKLRAVHELDRPSSVLASVFGNCRGKRCRCKSDASPSPAVGATKLLVDADAHSVEDVEDAIKQLEQTGTRVHTTVFAPPSRDKQKNWMQLLQRPTVTFRPVDPNSSRVGEATDGVIKCTLNTCNDAQSLALLTSDYDFIDAIQQAMDRGRPIIVFVPSKKRIVIERYQSAGVQVQEVKPRVSIFPKVRAILRSDGSGHVQLGKFWCTNELGSITVFPLQIGIKQVCQQMQNHGNRKWRRYVNNLAFFLPKSTHGARLNKTQTVKFGTGISKALFMGGGPFLLKDSANLVGEALRRLGYMDDDLNTDLQEAMLMFVNASKNKYNLRKPLDALPSPTDTAAELEDKLRYAFLSHSTDGQWLPAPKDGYIRQHLCKQGFLADVKAARREVFRAMAKYARQHQLPEMKTYNGYVFQLRRRRESSSTTTATIQTMS